MARKNPLSVRLYFEPPLTELVRLVGYDTLPLEDAKARFAPLAEKYGKDRMSEAAKAVLEMDGQEVRLSPAARRAAWQLLGPPPTPAAAS